MKNGTCNSSHECTSTTSVEVDDGNPCTIDDCDADTGDITHEKILGTCDDGDKCTVGDVCSPDGYCVGSVVSCDGVVDPCLQKQCNQATGKCDLPSTNGTLCSDGNLCNGTETCSGGQCVAGQPLSCVDANTCNGVEVCIPATGCAPAPSGNLADGAPCDDHDACTTGDACSNGYCQAGAPKACEDGKYCNGISTCDKVVGCNAAVPPTLSDGVDCTVDACDETLDKVTHTPQDSLCNDNNPCTTDKCIAATGCTHEPLNGLSCNDGNACTSPDTCQNGSCSGPQKTCDDADPCTLDTCKVQSGQCANTSICADGQFCSGNQQCYGPLITIATVAASDSGMVFAVGDTKVYYAGYQAMQGHDGKIMSASISGGASSVAWTNEDCINYDNIIYYGGHASYVAWCNGFQTSYLLTIPTANEEKKLVGETLGPFARLQVDGGMIYWTNSNETVFSSSIVTPECVADVFTWDCTSTTITTIAGLSDMVESGSYIYATAKSPARVIKVNKMGGEQIVLKQESNGSIRYGALAVYADRIYWTAGGGSNWNNGRVYTMNTSGTNFATANEGSIADSWTVRHGSMAADDTGVYWTSDLSANIMHYSVVDGVTRIIMATSGNGPHYMILKENGVYWRSMNGIYRLVK